jgi:hypothetical protein
MKALKYLAIGLVALIFAFFIGAYIIWLGYPKKYVNVFILDKTVKDLSRNEHKSLFWVLNNGRFVNSEGHSYAYTQDYFGFFPLTPIKNREFEIRHVTLSTVDSLSKHNDVLYFVDTYGVYFSEWFEGMRRSESSSAIDGGINSNNYLLLKTMFDMQKLVILEFNTLGAPTTDLIRSKIEDIFRIHWTSWYCRYFESLDYKHNHEIPQKIVDAYKAAKQSEWEFKNSGMIFANMYGNVIVFENNDTIQVEMPILSTNDAFANKFKLAKDIPYENWIEIIQPNGAETMATFKFKGNDLLSSILKANNIPTETPAILTNLEGGKKAYYFAADFANNPVSMKYARLANSRKILDRLGNSPQKHFFFNYYFPLIENLLKEYSEQLPEK